MSHPPVETLNNPWSRRRHVELFFDMLQTRQLDVSRLITHRVFYENAPEMYAQLLNDRTVALGTIILWE
ncbi:MAG: hypothetical protein QXU11_02820 [Thermoproteota archaeon]